MLPPEKRVLRVSSRTTAALAAYLAGNEADEQDKLQMAADGDGVAGGMITADPAANIDQSTAIGFLGLATVGLLSLLPLSLLPLSLLPLSLLPPIQPPDPGPS